MNALLLRQRIFVILVLISLLAALGGRQPAQAAADTSLLVAVFTPTQEARLRFDALPFPVYSHIHSQKGEFVLTGMEVDQIQQLADAQLTFRVLDEDTRHGGYYLAYAPIKRAAPDWSAYGEVLFDGGSVVVLRADERKIDRLPDASAQLDAIPLTARPEAATVASPAAITPDPLVQSMLSQVTLENVRSYTGDLSGEWPVMVAGQPYTITTRNTYSGTPIQKATQFVGAHLAALNLDVEYHQWSGATYPNVIAELPGLTNPEEIYIIGGHLDDMPSSGRAPGADDNASGSVATLLAADILSQYQWGCTLRFAFWTGEEQGLNGSEAYAQRAHSAGENIQGYLNLDMIAWNSGSSAPGIDLLYSTSMPSTLQLAQLFADTVDAYDLNLTPQLITSLGGGSDHSSFWDQGYTAILAIEDQGDFNPYYHSINDDMDNFEDWGYYVTFVQAAIGTFAHMSGCLIPNGMGAVQGTVSDAADGLPIENATLSFETRHGSGPQTSTNATGYYTQTLPTETYTVTAAAYGYTPATVGNIAVISNSVTTQDFSLTVAPTYTVSGAVHDLASGIPLFANLVVEGTPVDIWTDPTDGSYQLSLPEGTYTLQVNADGYKAQTRPIDLNSSQVQDFFLEALACVLLVDDDDNSPNVQSYYTSALDALNLDYDVRDTLSEGEPTLSDLNGYRHVFWFTGNDYQSTLSNADETNLGGYLTGGGSLFLSAQDYLYDRGLNAFGQNYLHVASFQNDEVQTSVSGTNVFSGLGPYSLTYPFTNYADIVQPDAGGQVAFTGNLGNAATSYDGETFHAVFLAYPLEAVSPTGRQEIISRALDFFGGCGPLNGHIAGQVSDSQTGQGIPGATLGVEPGSSTATTNGLGAYTLTLPPGTYDLAVQHACYVSETLTDIQVSDAFTTTQNVVLQPLPPIAAIQASPIDVHVEGTQPITRSVGITNTGCASLTYTATIATDSPWLRIENAGGEVAPAAGTAVQLILDAGGLAHGTYTATLSIQTNDPAQPLTTIPVRMTGGACTPIAALDFEWAPTSPLAGETITFTASATGTQPITFTWYLDGQAFGSGATISLGDASPGEYEVSLNASNFCTAEAQISQTLRVWLQKVFLALVMRPTQP
ncbi:MAG: M20/M25/M40 family metallo-hydrolase [Chloroflexota bacterium]